MVVFETERLVFETLELDDIDTVMTFWGDKEVMKYCGGAGTKDRELRALQYYINMQQEKGFSPYKVIVKDSGETIGVCGFNPPARGYDTELMYHLLKNSWGKGYATEAAMGCIDYAKRALNISKIGASVDPKNVASQRVLIKVGFHFVGLMWCEETKQDEYYYEMKITNNLPLLEI